MTSPQPTYDAVLDIIHKWPASQRYLLVQDVLKTLEPQDELQERPQRARDILATARGLLATEQPTPTDEEIAQWLEEHRTEKYG